MSDWYITDDKESKEQCRKKPNATTVAMKVEKVRAALRKELLEEGKTEEEIEELFRCFGV
ncbi:hypothetical protein AB1K83_14290 [Sporosarcina sp. 179-K 3D1 HS]|uniref:hypothetical protein n=1 Tax=Sporosarcina sp. 179-K 3D1 HS TaxID=3232169 RepID=UPI0039A3CA92